MAARRSPRADPLGPRPLLLGMVHLLPLPGSPRAAPVRGRAAPAWKKRAVADAKKLSAAGFHGVLIENHGDVPFFKDRVPAETVAAMAIAATAVRDALPAGVAIGVNVLRNDASAAIAIAAAAGLDFIRVNVLTGAVLADQGIVEGRAADVLRLRSRLSPRVRILADVRVKHATQLAPRVMSDEVRETLGRGGADMAIVTGTGTGEPVDEDALHALREAVPEATLLVGSGADAESVGWLLESADGVIVGTSIKRGGNVSEPVDAARARAFVRAARKA